jgi:hypothetical protein
MSRLSEKLRYGSLGALLVLTLIAAAVPGQNGDDGVVQATAPAQAQARPGAADGATGPPRIALERMRRESSADPARDLFVSKSWYVAPPPPPPVVVEPPAPPPPTAPPVPFSYMGKLVEEPSQRPVFFLVKGDRLYTVAEGELIDDTYRLEGVASGQLAVTYLPLNVRQFIPLGSGS